MADNVTSLFSIPGNVKQGFLPFCLDPSATINSSMLQGSDLKSAKPQIFSFRPYTLDNAQEYPRAEITPYPASMKRYIRDDIGSKLIYDNSCWDFGAELSFNRLMDNMPGIQIREYLPDSRMDQVLNTFSAFMDGFSFAMNDASGEEVESGTDGFKVKMSKLGIRLKNFVLLLKDNWQGILDPLLDMDNLLGNSDDSFGNFSKHDSSYQNYVLKFPYMMYYLFLSSTTTNIYELPYSGKSIMSSDGSQGWNKNGIDSLVSEGKNGGLVSKLLNFVGKNIRLNTTPTWSPADGQGLDVEFEVDLFNDRMDTAINNFILVNTLIPNNMWMQYHIYQHSPSVYDVKIEGLNRLYMCAGKFDCEGLGVLRNPPEEFFNELENCMNPNFDIQARYLFQDRLVKIPDIYRLKLKFTTLIPMNFNNYLYGYSRNVNMREYADKHDTHQDSVRENFIKNNLTGFIGKIKETWDKSKANGGGGEGAQE